MSWFTTHYTTQMEDTKVTDPPYKESNRPAERRAALVFILVTFFLDLLGATILGPVQVYIIRQYSSKALVIGSLSVVFAGAQFVAAPILGRLSDRHGRRPLLLICILGSAIGGYTFGIGGALWVFFLSRLVDGLTGGNLSIAQAYVADVTPPQERARNFGLIGAMFGLAFILGPALGGVLGQASAVLPAFVSGTLSLLSLTFALFALPESLPRERCAGGRFQWQEVNPFAVMADVIRLSNLGALLLALFGFNLAFNAMTNNVPLYLIDKFGARPLDSAGLFVTVGVVHIVVQGGIVGRLVPRLGEKRVALIGLVVQVFGYLGVAWSPSLWAVYPVTVLITTGIALAMPSLNALVTNSVPSDAQGQVAGVSAAVVGVTSVLGPLWAGVAYDCVMPSAPYWTGALLLALVCLPLARVRLPARPLASPTAE